MSRLLVTQYQAEVEKIIRYGGSKKETSIRNAFERLLNDYCKPRNYLLIPELDFKTKFNTTVFPDGTVKDAIRLEHGWWESKDQYDNLDEEIEKKLEKGYPDENILFEDSQTAVLIQHSREQLRVSMRDAEALDGLISTFVDYERPEVRDFRAAITKFKEDIPHILVALRDIITQQEEGNTQFRERRNAFLEVCRQSINPEIEIFDIHEMLIQHILTEDIFTNIFHESQFHRENNIARELSEIINTFFTGNTRRNTLKSIEHYYAVIRRHSENIANHHEKQKFLKAVYENFYKAYNPKAADRLGIVYTPNEIVRFMIESADYLTHKHFGKLLSDPGVEILDPCTGTGTYVTELIEYLPADKLEHKYKHEIHCNEVAILPYYIANLNIEFTYQQKMGEYEEFKNICLVDTLDHTTYEGKQGDLFSMSVENTERIRKQNEKEIFIIIGNPPYNALQANFNHRNANRAYKGIDQRIKDTYAKYGTAQNQTAIYDMYTRFLRWASDRLGRNGIVSFVSNSSFIDSKAYDGFRKVVAQEFSEMWIIDMKGNARTSAERRKKEGGNVFSDEIRVGIAVYFLVRNQKAEGFKIFYNTIGDYVEADEKKKYFSSNSLSSLSFSHAQPSKSGNWINLTDNDFDGFLPLIDKEVKAGRSQEAVFQIFSRGVETGRDEWVFDFSESCLQEKVKYLIEAYQRRLEKNERIELDIKWDRELESDLSRNIQKKFETASIRTSIYRPFSKEFIYFDENLNRMPGLVSKIFHSQDSENQLIAVTNHTQIPFLVQAANCIPALDVGGRPTQCLPLYRHDENGNRIDNITDWALEQFRQHYRSPCPSDIPIIKGDSSVAPLVKGGSRGDQIDYAAIAQQRHLPYQKGHLPYNPKLVERAKAMRKDMTKAEKKLWYDFLKTFPEQVLRQRPIDHFIIDFYCPALKLVIEVDGGQHYSEEGQATDAERTTILESYGLQVLRFSNHEVLHEFESVCQVIEEVRSPCSSDIPLNKGDSTIAPLVKRGSRGDQITKLDIFHYTYAVLHHPAYRTKYELNLKREFPRLPFYADFYQWAAWGKALMDLHLNYEAIEPYGLRRVDVGRKKSASDAPLQATLIPIDAPDPAKPIKRTTPKAKLKADKTEGKIILDTETTLEGVPAIAWDYKLGNRSALEWILDQYKEKKPKDPTIAKLFNTYKFADYKEHVIDLLDRVCTVSVRTMAIIQQMPDTVEHQSSN